jgi:hypothetical protein
LRSSAAATGRLEPLLVTTTLVTGLASPPRDPDTMLHRRECLDHVIVLGVAGLQRVLTDYVAYGMNTRTHPSLGKDAPASRPATSLSAGRIVEIPQVNGLHHRYDRVAAL